jgi:hypothetical protein
LDETSFEKSMKEEFAIQEKIRRGVLDGRKAGAISTPTVFINDRSHCCQTNRRKDNKIFFR